MRRIRLACLLLAATVTVAAVAAAAAAAPLDRVVAHVGDRLLLASDIRVARVLGLAGVTRTDDEAAAARRLIDRELALTDVDRARPSEPEAAAVARERAALVAAAGSEAAALTALQEAGLPAGQLDRLARDTARIDVYLRQRFGVELTAAVRAAWLADLRRRGAVRCLIPGC